MTLNNFIFSNKFTHRVTRHLTFWICFSVHFFIQSLIIGKANEALYPRSSLESLINISYFLPIYIISTYVFIDLIIPGFLFKRKYSIFFISASLLLLINFAACYFSGLLYEHIEWKIPYKEITFADNKYHAIVNGGFVSIMVLGIAGGIKLAKKWLQKQRENEALAQQKIISELQLLKIQINPRFLFHSLHTLKQHILTSSPRAPYLILQVSDLLSYILYESDQDNVLLEKELSIVTDYLTLEEDSSSENLKINTSISGEVSGKYIAPLILLSIVETSFEYFIEKKEKFSSKLSIEIKDNQLDFRITYGILNYNSHELYDLNQRLTGVQKQLQSLYAGNHNFRIESASGSTTIFLQKIPLYNDKPVRQELIATSNIVYEDV